MKTQKNLNWNARDYAKNSSAQEQWAKELVGKLNLKGNETGLDIGCGDGRITHMISRQIPHGGIIGIDYSHDMVILAKELYQDNNVSFYEMNAMEIDLNHRFDFAFSNATLHWVSDHKRVLATLSNHLNSGARILFQMGGKGNASEIISSIDQVLKDSQWRQYFNDFDFPYFFNSDADYEKWLGETGYRPTRIELIAKDMVHESVEHLKGWLRTTWFPFTDRLPKDLREGFLDELLDHFQKIKPVDAMGRTHVNMIRLEIEAVW